MAIKELDGGQAHAFAPTALRVQLTGASHNGGVVLKAVDQAGHEAVTVRLTDVEIVLTPEPRRLRLVAAPSFGGSFSAGTSLGLTLRTEGASTAAEQILVSSVDVGALAMHEIAVLEFATDRAILTVSGNSGGIAPTQRAIDETFTSGTVFTAQEVSPRHSPQADQEHIWLRPGRYALRDAQKLGTIDTPVSAWGVVLDGSASMHRLYCSGQLQVLLGLVCGTYVQWTSQWATAVAVAGVRLTELEAPSLDPHGLADAAFGESEPASWSRIAEGAAHVLRRLGNDGAVLIVTDGVPGDIDRLATLCRDNSDARFTIVTTGVSRHGLISDGEPAWWQEELAGLECLENLPNCRAVAVRIRPDQQLELAGSRAAEIALRLTTPASTGVPT